MAAGATGDRKLPNEIATPMAPGARVKSARPIRRSKPGNDLLCNRARSSVQTLRESEFLPRLSFLHSPGCKKRSRQYPAGNITKAKADEATAADVAISPGAAFSVRVVGTATLTAGTVFTVINNTASTPIDGVFFDLPDGATIAINGANLRANYEGGDGNDLTLTVQ